MNEPVQVDSPVQCVPGGWQVVGAAAAGGAHLKAGLACQDAQGYRRLPGDLLLLALADGAGSARYADQAARAAVDAALYALEDRLARSPGFPAPASPDGSPPWQADLLREAFAQARMALVDLALESGESLREYATTLTCAVVGPDWLAAGQLGDGALVVRFLDSGQAPARLAAILQPQRGEYANETYFLTQMEALQQVQVEVVASPVQALAVISDGLLRLALKLPAGEPHPPFFQPLFAFAAGSEDALRAAGRLQDFLTSERVCARTDDDKSILIAVRQ